MKLIKKSGIFPECLILQEVKQLGQSSVAGGSFGDIWQGEMGVHPVAIKVMRVFDQSKVDGILKVRCLS